MKKVALIACVAALCCASFAWAQDEISATNPLGMGWTACAASPNQFGLQNVSFACAAEASNACRDFKLLPTFVSTITDSRFAGSTVVINLIIGNTVPGQWWSGFAPSSCRGQQAISTSGPVTAGTTVCANPYPGTAGTLPGQSSGQYHALPNHFRITSSNSVNPTQPLTSGQRNYAMQLDLKTDGTLADCDPTFDNTPLCTDGCSVGACFNLNNVDIFMAVDGNTSTPDIIHYTDNGGGRAWCTYNSGTGVCPGATPTRQSTWGSVKALYR